MHKNRCLPTAIGFSARRRAASNLRCHIVHEDCERRRQPRHCEEARRADAAKRRKFKCEGYKYAVFGNPVAHSLSPLVHQAFAKQTGQAMTYESRLVPLKGFEQALTQFKKEGGCGLNVTLPFKEEAYRLSASLSDRAQTAKAVNTLVLQKNSWFGDNTDGVGLVRDLVVNHGILLEGKRILVLGAGGAARGIIGSLLSEKCLEIVIANRTSEKAERLATYFQGFSEKCFVRGIGYSSLTNKKHPVDGIINATSASLQGTVPLISPDICQNKWCYDLAYKGVQETFFQRWAAQNGAQPSLNGLGMLVEQAAESFFIWRGIKPYTKPVLEMLQQSCLLPPLQKGD